MSQDSDHPKSDLLPNSAGGGGGASSPAEDPLVELARIVHRNKQTGASASGGRVESTDYFSDLDDLGGTQQASAEPAPEVDAAPEPKLEPAATAEGEQVASSPAAPSAEVEGIPWPSVPSLEEIETTASQAMQRSAAGNMNIYSSPGSKPTPDEHADYDLPQGGLEQSVTQNLEESLTAELEDELIGAFRQSFTPTGVSRTEPAEPFQYGGYEAESEPEPQLSESEAGYQVAGGAFESEAVPSGYDSVVSGGQGPSFGAPANDSTPVEETDLFVGLNELDEQSQADHPQPATEQSAIDTLFADLEFSPHREPAAMAPESEKPETAEAYDEPGKSDDIDDMVWPAAASAIPVTEDDETPPPPEGYDLDAVARAMQESDPSLQGSGILPPHPREELAAAPGAEEKSRKGLYAAAAVLAVVVIGGGSFLLFDGSSVDVPSGPPPVIAGLEGPLKVYPEEQPAEENRTSKLIYDRVGAPDGQSEERMVMPEETTPAELPPAPEGVVSSDSLVSGGPKKVRTLVVRPDGTIISGEPETPSAPLRTVETTPVQPQTETPAPVGAAVPAAPAKPEVAVSSATPAPARPQTPPAASETQAPAAPAAIVTTVVPRKKPAVPAQVARAPQATSPVRTSGPLDLSQPAPQTTAPAATTGRIAAGTYVVQVTSQRSEEAARSAYQALQRRYPGVLGSREAVIVTANLEDRGVFYRARIPTGSRDEAISLCEQLKAAGGDCFVRRN